MFKSNAKVLFARELIIRNSPEINPTLGCQLAYKGLQR